MNAFDKSGSILDWSVLQSDQIWQAVRDPYLCTIVLSLDDTVGSMRPLCAAAISPSLFSSTRPVWARLKRGASIRSTVYGDSDSQRWIDRIARRFTGRNWIAPSAGSDGHDRSIAKKEPAYVRARQLHSHEGHVRTCWQEYARKRAAKIAGIEGFRPHDLRHSAASFLHVQRAPKKTISVFMGHASTRITDDIYTHLFQDELNEAANQIEQGLEAAIERRRKTGDLGV